MAARPSGAERRNVVRMPDAKKPKPANIGRDVFCVAKMALAQSSTRLSIGRERARIARTRLVRETSVSSYAPPPKKSETTKWLRKKRPIPAQIERAPMETAFLMKMRLNSRLSPAVAAAESAGNAAVAKATPMTVSAVLWNRSALVQEVAEPGARLDVRNPK